MKLNESTISMVLGAIVIIVVGYLIVNYFKNIDQNGSLPPIETTSETVLPTTHVVAVGEDLWSISERYYDSGYNWVDIAEANDLANPGMISEGQELIIPVAQSRTTGDSLAQEQTITEAPNPTAIPTQVMQEIVPTKAPVEMQPSQPTMMSDISGGSYTVVKGDNLWNIAVRAYGDGYRWVEIAQANELVNPSLIHPGNVFVLPR